VPGETSAIFGGRKMELRQTVKAVTPLGGLVVFVDFLRKVRLAAEISAPAWTGSFPSI
jgi:hypothetical protein